MICMWIIFSSGSHESPIILLSGKRSIPNVVRLSARNYGGKIGPKKMTNQQQQQQHLQITTFFSFSHSPQINGNSLFPSLFLSLFRKKRELLSWTISKLSGSFSRCHDGLNATVFQVNCIRSLAMLGAKIDEICALWISCVLHACNTGRSSSREVKGTAYLLRIAAHILSSWMAWNAMQHTARRCLIRFFAQFHAIDSHKYFLSTAGVV